MSNPSGQADSGGGQQNGRQRKSLVVPAVVIAVLIVIAALSLKTLQFFPAAAPSPPTDTDATRPVPEAESANTSPGAQSATQSPTVATQYSAAEARQLLATLAAVDGKTPITAVQGQKWNESLRQLIRQGAAVAPGIQQFLAQNLDANYAGVSGAEQLGYTSLRGALLDALDQIGEPEATAAMLQTLKTSIYPSDIATLARLLEAQGAGAFQADILGAVRRQLSLAAADQLDGANVGPLYQVLADSGSAGATVTSDLAQYATKWPYYSTIALAGLPDNAGVSLLIQMAQGTLPGNQAVAAQALGELAPQNADASNTLFTLAKSGQLDDSTVAQLAPFLGGRRCELIRPANADTIAYNAIHTAIGNQDYVTLGGAGNLTPTQALQRISMIDQLSAALPSGDAAALDALQQQKTALAARLGVH